jgi:glutathione gamma-glutamylcysteinyltransferase
VTLYRRPLPTELVPFSSKPGRRLFAEALAEGGLEGFFPLIEQFHTQSDPAFCGLASLVMALNTLGIDPGRTWRGPWRWFSEELLTCCAPLSRVRQIGVTLEEVACLGRCNGAEVSLERAGSGEAGFRQAVREATQSSDRVLVAAYDRAALGQTGSGHFSPLGGYHSGQDLVLVLDVARFKYPPHWVPLPALYAAMTSADPLTRSARGWLSLARRGEASVFARYLTCVDGVSVRAALERLTALYTADLERERPVTLQQLLAVAGNAVTQSELAAHVTVRTPEEAEEREHLQQLWDDLQTLPLCVAARATLPPHVALATALWLMAAPASLHLSLAAPLRHSLGELTCVDSLPTALRADAALLRSQLEFLLQVCDPLRCA